MEIQNAVIYKVFQLKQSKLSPLVVKHLTESCVTLYIPNITLYGVLLINELLLCLDRIVFILWYGCCSMYGSIAYTNVSEIWHHWYTPFNTIYFFLICIFIAPLRNMVCTLWEINFITTYILIFLTNIYNGRAHSKLFTLYPTYMV